MKTHTWFKFIILLLPLSAFAQPAPIFDNAGRPFLTPPSKVLNKSIDDFIETAKAEQERTLQKVNMLNDQMRFLSKQINFYQTVAAAQASMGIKWLTNDDKTNTTGLFNLNINGRPIQFCRALFIDGLHTGILKREGCLITYNGNSLIIQTYEALRGKAYTRWKKIDSMYKYINFDTELDLSVWKQSWVPIISGFINRNPLYICKANYNNQTYIGKAYLDECKFAVDSKEVSVKDFEILFGEVMSGQVNK